MTVRTACHPEARGRVSKEGDMQYDVFLPLETGETLHILMGAEGHATLRNLFVQSFMDDTVEGLLTNG